MTTNGLVWKLVSTGVRLTSLPCGRRVRVPVYSQLGSGQYGRVFEVQLLGRVTEESSEAQTLSGKSGESSGADDEPRSLSSFPKNARLRETASEVRQALGLRSDFLFAAKLLPLPDFETQGATADLLREFALYGEVEGSLSGKSLNAGVPFPKTTASSCPKEAAADPQHSKSGGEREADFAPPPFANVVRVFGVKSSVRFSRAFSETYLSGVRTAGVLILERCFGDLASYVRRLYGANKMKIAALKFYAWQLLNGASFSFFPFAGKGCSVAEGRAFSARRLRCLRRRGTFARSRRLAQRLETRKPPRCACGRGGGAEVVSSGSRGSQSRGLGNGAQGQGRQSSAGCR